MLNMPKLILGEKLSFSSVEKQLKKIDSHKIGINNWSDQYPYTPNVEFKIAHDGENVFLQFFVKEKEILAKARGNNSEVWTDSCVEFFISFDDSGFYYNLEQSCIGEVLLGYRKEKKDCIHAPDYIIDAIKRQSSLGKNNFDLQKGEFEWSLLSIIPITSFWKHDLQNLDGINAKANFYKCGDKLATPHYLSWAPIDTDSPDFHREDFFKKIFFNQE